jgi:hypothetical protein
MMMARRSSLGVSGYEVSSGGRKWAVFMMNPGLNDGADRILTRFYGIAEGKLCDIAAG